MSLEMVAGKPDAGCGPDRSTIAHHIGPHARCGTSARQH
jgi:hypothetical protein